MSAGDALAGRVAFVCGATGPIGSAVARSLSTIGVAVAVHCHSNTDAAAKLAASLETPACVVPADLTSYQGATAAVAAAEEQLGARVTVLVNAAAARVSPTFVSDMDNDDFETNLAALRIQVNACRAVLPGMRAAGGGRIVLVSGALAERLHPGFSLFAAAKAGANAFSRTLALEEGRHGITVNVVSPGRVAEPGDDFIPASFQSLADVMRMRRALPADPTTAEVAAVVAWLVSASAAAVSGEVIHLAAGEPI